MYSELPFNNEFNYKLYTNLNHSIFWFSIKYLRRKKEYCQDFAAIHIMLLKFVWLFYSIALPFEEGAHIFSFWLRTIEKSLWFWIESQTIRTIIFRENLEGHGNLFPRFRTSLRKKLLKFDLLGPYKLSCKFQWIYHL